jgi:hypothetical protein
LLAELDYPSLQTAWRGDLAALIGLKRVTDAQARGEEDDRVVGSLMDVLSRGCDVLKAQATPVPPLLIHVRGSSGDDAVIRVDPDRGPTRLGPSTERDEPSGLPSGSAAGAETKVLCHGDVLLRVSAGTVNLAQAVHDAEVRFDLDQGAAGPVPRTVMKALGTLLRAGADSSDSAGGAGGPPV